MNYDLIILKTEELRGLRFSIVVFALTGALILYVLFIKHQILNLGISNYLGLALLLNGVGSFVVAARSYQLMNRVSSIVEFTDFQSIKKSFYKTFFFFFCVPYLAATFILFSIKDNRGGVTMLTIFVFTGLLIYKYDWKYFRE